MSSSPAAVQILCRQCSAPLPVEQGIQLVTCEYCGTTNYVDKGRTVIHYAVQATVRENDAQAALRRWMAGNKTVKGLDSKAQIEVPLFQHFPMWLIRVDQNGKEKVFLEPAAALSISELKRITIPAADLVPYDHSLDDSSVEATVPYDAMLRWLKDDSGVSETDIREVSLVHLPTYQFKYTFKDRRYTALVDAATGEVFANIYPSNWEAPYLTIAAVAFALYFCAALIPLGSFLTNGFTGLGVGMGIYALAVAVLAVPIFLFATYISAKV
jgi:hypothetical protein